LLACIFLLGLVVTAVVYVSFFAADLPKYGAGEQEKLILLLTALLAAIGILAYASFSKSMSVRLIGAGVAMAIVLAVLPWVIPEVTLERKAPVAFLRQAYAEAPGGVVVVTNGSLVRATSWALKRQDVYVIDGRGETTYGLSAEDAAGRYLSGAEFSNLLSSAPNVLLLCIRSCSEDTLERLPSSTRTSSYGSFSSYLVVAGDSPGGATKAGLGEH
jgi:hypothetical protein